MSGKYRRPFTKGDIAKIHAMAKAGSNLTECAKAVGRLQQSVSPYWHQIVDKPRITDPLADRPVDQELRNRWSEMLPEMRDRIIKEASKR
jgi:hypothetical protein